MKKLYLQVHVSLLMVGCLDSFTVVIDIAMVDVDHIDVFQCNSVHSSDLIGIDPSW